MDVSVDYETVGPRSCFCVEVVRIKSCLAQSMATLLTQKRVASDFVWKAETTFFDTKT